MKINIYYGGRGLIGDPTLYVLNKIQEVLRELNVNVERYDLYEFKNNIVTLPQTLKDADGVILATTVEWYGIGGYMQQFLDSCWLYGDKEKIGSMYMCPVVMATTYGEHDAEKVLTEAWEIQSSFLAGVRLRASAAMWRTCQNSNKTRAMRGWLRSAQRICTALLIKSCRFSQTAIRQ